MKDFFISALQDELQRTRERLPIIENEDVQRALARSLCDWMFSDAWGVAGFLAHCESPIEQIMFIALRDCVKADSILPQYKVETDLATYRLDFCVIKRVEGQEIRIAVECDGHEFHERTKEQAQWDKARDRAIQRLGITVLRFTGSEIYRDPDRCAMEVNQTLRALFEAR